MLVRRAYRYELDSSNHRLSSLSQHAGTVRFAYNWGLKQKISLYREKEGKNRFTNVITQDGALNRLKKTQFQWMYEAPKCAPHVARHNAMLLRRRLGRHNKAAV
jgi:putative transposase